MDVESQQTLDEVVDRAAAKIEIDAQLAIQAFFNNLTAVLGKGFSGSIGPVTLTIQIPQIPIRLAEPGEKK